MPAALAARPPGYAEWLAELKARVQAAQQRAALSVNRELLTLYWQLGRDILERQAREGWGAGVIDQVSADLEGCVPPGSRASRARTSSTCAPCRGLARSRNRPTIGWPIAVGPPPAAPHQDQDEGGAPRPRRAGARPRLAPRALGAEIAKDRSELEGTL